MILGKKKVLFFLFFYLIFNFSNLNADNHNIYEVLEIIATIHFIVTGLSLLFLFVAYNEIIIHESINYSCW